MGSSSYIDINLNKQYQLDVLKILESLMKCGWNLDDYGKINYLPLGDKDEFNWVAVEQNKKERVLDDLTKKQKLNELVGVVLTYQETQVGGSFLFSFDQNQISFSISVNRKILNDGVTDFDWYLNKLSLFFKKYETDIVSIKSYQIDSSGEIEYEKILNPNQSEFL